MSIEIDKPTPATTPATTPAAAAAFEGVTRRFGQVTAVDGLTLGIGRGQTVALLGPNGAGKTTTVELLLGLRKEFSTFLSGIEPDKTALPARCLGSRTNHINVIRQLDRTTIPLPGLPVA